MGWWLDDDLFFLAVAWLGYLRIGRLALILQKPRQRSNIGPCGALALKKQRTCLVCNVTSHSVASHVTIIAQNEARYGTEWDLRDPIACQENITERFTRRDEMYVRFEVRGLQSAPNYPRRSYPLCFQQVNSSEQDSPMCTSESRPKSK